MRAVTTAVEAPLDLHEVASEDGLLFVRDGVGIAGQGVAARLPADDAARLLAGVEHNDRVGGRSPIALGSIGFAPGSAAELILPEVLVGRAADGSQWMTTIDGAQLRRRAMREPALPSGYAVRPHTPVKRYLDAVVAARDAVRAGTITKAVIARQVEVRAEQPIDVGAVLDRLRATFGSSYRFCVDGLIGASPELLVEVDRGVVRSHPLAGTVPRTGDPAADAAAAADLLHSVKDHVEHRVVIEMIHDTLLPWCSYLDWEPEPSVIAVANVQHLATALEGRLSDPPAGVIELVRALCPTPALGGFPRDPALALIGEVEGFERGRYGGAVGWVDGQGNGTWAVTIRCAELSDDRTTAVLSAGGGIVAASEPRAELAETQAKFQAMLSAIVRP